jgi:hypothetical protein
MSRGESLWKESVCGRLKASAAPPPLTMRDTFLIEIRRYSLAAPSLAHYISRLTPRLSRRIYTPNRWFFLFLLVVSHTRRKREKSSREPTLSSSVQPLSQAAAVWPQKPRLPRGQEEAIMAEIDAHRVTSPPAVTTSTSAFGTRESASERWSE